MNMTTPAAITDDLNFFQARAKLVSTVNLLIAKTAIIGKHS